MPKNNSMESIFNAVVSAESDAIFRFCMIHVSDREQALEITQETFLRLWKKIQERTKIENARAFLYKVSHNLIIDWYRKKKAVPLLKSHSDDDSEETIEPADETTSHLSLEMGAEGRYLLDNIQKLQPLHRQAVYLRYVEGLSPPDIGDILGIQTNAASVRVHRGLRELQKLTGYG